MRLSPRLVLAVALLLTPLAGHAIAPPWAAAGNTGTITPGNFWYSFNPSTGVLVEGIILTWNNGGITFSSGFNGTGTYSVTYNVTSPQASPGWTTLEMGYSIASGGGVVTTLYQVNPNTGAKTTLCSVGSATGATYQGCDFTTAMNFNSFAYYVQVDLGRTAKTQFPQINYLKIH